MKTFFLIVFAVMIIAGAIVGPTTPETLQAKYPSWTTAECERVYNHEIWLGMTRTMAFESLGFADNYNRSVSSAGTRVQLVYRGGCNYFRGYLYFQNGRLTSWQD